MASARMPCALNTASWPKSPDPPTEKVSIPTPTTAGSKASSCAASSAIPEAATASGDAG